MKSLVGHLDKLNPSELFALAMQAGVLKDKGKPFVMALTNGKFPIEELEKFVNGQRSMVDVYASGGGIGGDALVLEPTVRAEDGLKAPAPIDTRCRRRPMAFTTTQGPPSTSARPSTPARSRPRPRAATPMATICR